MGQKKHTTHYVPVSVMSLSHKPEKYKTKSTCHFSNLQTARMTHIKSCKHVPQPPLSTDVYSGQNEVKGVEKTGVAWLATVGPSTGKLARRSTRNMYARMTEHSTIVAGISWEKRSEEFSFDFSKKIKIKINYIHTLLN